MLPLLPLLLAGCVSTVPRYPGPVSWVGRAPPPAAQILEVEPEVTSPEPAAVAAHHPRGEPKAKHTRLREDPLGRSVGAAARHYLSHAPEGFRDDCSGFVSASLSRAGFQIVGSSRSLWDGARAARATHRRARPSLGDIAFFDNTYDRDRDGRWDDELTHVAVVIEVQEDGTVVLAHAGTSKGRDELRLNLEHAAVHIDDSGKILNDYLRRPSKGDDDKSRYLAAQLWRSWATPRSCDLSTWKNP